MHISTTFNQNRETGLLAHYDGTSFDKYLSDSSSYSDNESNLRSDDYNNYESNYKFDNEKALCISTSITKTPLIQLPNVKKQKANVTYTLRQKKFNDKF